MIQFGFQSIALRRRYNGWSKLASMEQEREEVSNGLLVIIQRTITSIYFPQCPASCKGYIYIYIYINLKKKSNKQCVSFQFLKGCWNLFFKTKVIWKVKCNNYFNISQIECHTAWLPVFSHDVSVYIYIYIYIYLLILIDYYSFELLCTKG